VVLWDLQQAARDKSERGLAILVECMEDAEADWNTRLRAIELLWERGYGRPQVSVDLNMTHSFAEVPQVMSLEEWVARKGQPQGDDRWLLTQQRASGVAAPQEKRTSGGPSAPAGASSGPVLDLQADDPLLTAVDPTKPPPAGSKLN
jgi:hypothetical protein